MRLGSSLKILRGHRGALEAVKYSFDGRYLFSGGWDREIRLWDTETGELVRVFYGHTDWVNGFALHHEGRIFASASRDNTIKIWDIDSGDCLKTITTESKESCTLHTVAFSPDGETIIFAGNSAEIFEWDLKENKLKRILKQHEKSIYCLHYSNDGKKILSCSGDTNIFIWDQESGTVLHTLANHDAAVQYAKFNFDCSKIVSGSKDGTIRIWDALTAQELQKFEASSSIHSVDFCIDDKRVAGCGEDRTIYIVDVDNGKLLQSLKGHESNILSVKFSPDGENVASGGGADRSVRIWNLKEFAQSLDNNLISHQEQIEKYAFSPCEEYLVTASRDGSVGLWNTQNGKLIKQIIAHEKSARAVCFSPCGQKIATVSLDKTLKIWNTNLELLTVIEDHTNAVNAVTYSDSGRMIATAGADKKIIVRESEKYQKLHTLEGHERTIYDVAFNHNEDKLVSCGKDGTTKVWDLKNGTIIAEKKVSEDILTTAFSLENQEEVIYTTPKDYISHWNYLQNKTRRSNGKGNAKFIAQSTVYYGITSGWKSKIIHKENNNEIALPGKIEQLGFSYSNKVAGIAGNYLLLFKLEIFV